MRRLWDRWLGYCGRDADARPLALTRVLLPVVLILDLARLLQLGLVDDLFRHYDHGGIHTVLNPHLWLDNLSPEWGGPVAVAVVMAALACVAAGVLYRPALLVALLGYAQLGHLCGPSDRGIDRILRTVMLILLFSEAHRHFALKKPWKARIPAWPQDLVRYLLVLVYLNSGFAKLLGDPVGWLGFEGIPQLYRIVANPVAGHVDPVLALEWSWFFWLGGWFTILLELSALLLLTRYAHWWALAGVALHLGIAATMELGMFSWGMLALYPILFAESPWLNGRRSSASP